MKIEIKNKITLDKDTEEIHEVYDCDLTEKGQYLYLIYHNAENEKVVIKVNDTNMTMSRFSKPQSIMKFYQAKESLIAVPTPIGIQQFILKTHHYDFDRLAETLTISYDLKQADGQAIFASYHLTITWYKSR
ncbi:DUF1934 domain-containing protein [Streptococcus iniae]|uniref:DUF1934 domain-containing protein n=1 Tax=Streptococcus iniae TaxID=1346 RepID=A0A1J0MZV7_STRIN|nr:DUF1934 domain-containing protein [Streptococcus iniae]AGM99100.1 hypothetical protein K710_1335 [Streptococcus iniae SF1]AHY16045.1 hypothetical protein DQ08_06180 [Streptococcus iniae]AHY17908.1 hypothetical protein DW64_06175 [Streptococcus iniae]AJG26202.1 50S ribosomal protein L19 [Streptococcus iniae]APD32080.1 hypothetical protein BMF34_06240 [Streptococcus iniae]